MAMDILPPLIFSWHNYTPFFYLISIFVLNDHFFVLNENKPLCKSQTYIKALLIINYVQIGNYTDLHRIHWLPIMHDGFPVQ